MEEEITKICQTLVEQNKKLTEYFLKLHKIIKGLQDLEAVNEFSENKIMVMVQQMRKYFEFFDKSNQERNRQIENVISWFEKRFQDENEIKALRKKMS